MTVRATCGAQFSLGGFSGPKDKVLHLLFIRFFLLRISSPVLLSMRIFLLNTNKQIRMLYKFIHDINSIKYLNISFCYALSLPFSVGQLSVFLLFSFLFFSVTERSNMKQKY